MRVCGGALCRACTRFYETQPTAKQTAVRRAELLLRLLRPKREAQTQPEDCAKAKPQIPQAVIVAAAVDQLAAAWGVRNKTHRYMKGR